MTEAVRFLLLVFVPLAAAGTWIALRTARIPSQSPERLVAELRMAQAGALVLVFIAGAYLGFAASRETIAGVEWDIMLAFGFLLVGIGTMQEDPRRALTVLALAFAAHAIVDVAHRPGFLPEDVAPRWFAISCAIYNLYLGAICYLPILRR